MFVFNLYIFITVLEISEEKTAELLLLYSLSCSFSVVYILQ